MAIVKMKRVLFVTLVSAGEELLRRLQKLGVMHPQHVRSMGENREVAKLEHMLHVQRVVINALEKIEGGGEFPGAAGETPSFQSIEEWLGEKNRFVDRLSVVEKQIERQAVWGQFDPKDVGELENKELFVQLWRMEHKFYERMDIPKDSIGGEVRGGHHVTFFTFRDGGRLDIRGAEELPMPEYSLNELFAKREELLRDLDEVSEKLKMAAGFIKELKGLNENLENEHDFRVTLGRAFDDRYMTAFEGWVPEPDLEALRKDLKPAEPPVVIKARDPLPDETPPVLTRNSWLARAFEPLLHLLGVPNYRGLDPALFFAPFMMLFFGVCLGDAGYGMLMVIAGIVMKKLAPRILPALRMVGNLTMLFGVATIIWGLLTGSIFSIGFKDRAWIPIDVSQAYGNPMLLFKISIALGAIHLTIAFILAIFSHGSWQRKLSKFGFIAVLWGGIFGVLRIPHWWVVLSLGLLLILVFSAEHRNPFKRLGLGLWNVYLLTGLLGDLMSYARLFGLGIASAAIASVVNMLAMQTRDAVPFIGILIMILILVVGHAFNISIGIIGALVHPARLHAVEAFPKFVEMNGQPFRPLKR